MYNFKKNIYKTSEETLCNDVTIGAQIWTSCNLNVTEFRDGTPIPEITDPILWRSATTAAWCNTNPSTNGSGKLYNYYAVTNTVNGGLAPTGYHIPTIAEWDTLIATAGGISLAGGTLKEVGLSNWNTPNVGAIDTYGFKALGVGFRDGITGGYFSYKQYTEFWAYDLYSGFPLSYLVRDNYASISSSVNPETFGGSVRLVKD